MVPVLNHQLTYPGCVTWIEREDFQSPEFDHLQERGLSLDRKTQETHRFGHHRPNTEERPTDRAKSTDAGSVMTIAAVENGHQGPRVNENVGAHALFLS